MRLKFCLVWCFSGLSILAHPAFGMDNARDLADACLDRAKLLYERSEYDSLPYYYRFSENIYDSLNLHDRAGECMLGMVDYFRMKNQLSAASSALNFAESYIERHMGHNSGEWAEALFIRGKLYHSQNQEKEAISILNECLDLEQNLGRGPEKTARIKSVMGAVYYTFGDLDSAAFYYSKAYETYMGISSQPSMEKGILLFNIGLVYSQLKKMEKWVEYTLRGIENNITLYGPEFPDLYQYYSSLSSYFINSGKLDSATTYLDKAEQIMINSYGDEYYDLSRIYVNRARIYRYNGDFESSLEYYLEAVKLLEREELSSRTMTNAIYVNIGQLYRSLGDYQTAYQYYLRLLETEREVHPSKMAGYYSDIAEIEIHIGKFRDAEYNLKRVFELRKEHYDRDYYALAYDYQHYGFLMESTGRQKKAGEYYGRALGITRQNFSDFHSLTAKNHKILGDYYGRMGAYDSALYQYQHSIRALVPEYNMQAMDINPDSRLVTDPLFYLKLMNQKAAALEKLFAAGKGDGRNMEYLRAALAAYKSSVEVSEKLRNSYLNDASKLYLSENERINYEKGVELAFKCYEISADPDFLVNAFQIAEKGKYATLTSVLNREDALVLAGIPDSLLEMEYGMQKQLAVYQELLNESLYDTLPDQVKLQEYRAELFRIKDQLAGLHRSLESEYPEYFRLLYAQADIDPGQIRSGLGRDEKIIEYFLAGNELYIFELSRNGIGCRRQSADSLFYADLDQVERYIYRHKPGESVQDDHTSFIQSSSRLYKRLIPAVEDYKKLVIIPEGKLSYFPFDVLITEYLPEFSGLFRDVPFLISSHSIRYGYSAGLLEPGNPQKAGNLQHFIGFAPGYDAGEQAATDNDARREIGIDRRSLNPLPGSIEEVREIGHLLGGKFFTGPDASEKRFKQIAEEGHILHLATHAFLDDEDPLRSVLVFSENPDAADDGFLNVYELYNMDLKARLAVLSACNTGAGEMRGGEGIMSLARAFFYAGVPNIIMTQWTVSDRESYKLMVSFYENLKKGRKAEISLRNAKLDYLENALPGYQNPRYWAGYILVGNPENLFLPYMIRQFIAAAGIILLLLAGWIAIRRISGKKPVAIVS